MCVTFRLVFSHHFPHLFTFHSPLTSRCAHCKCGTWEYRQHNTGSSFLLTNVFTMDGYKKLGTAWLNVWGSSLSLFFVFFQREQKQTRLVQIEDATFCYLLYVFFIFAVTRILSVPRLLCSVRFMFVSVTLTGTPDVVSSHWCFGVCLFFFICCCCFGFFFHWRPNWGLSLALQSPEKMDSKDLVVLWTSWHFSFIVLCHMPFFCMLANWHSLAIFKKTKQKQNKKTDHGEAYSSNNGTAWKLCICCLYCWNWL